MPPNIRREHPRSAFEAPIKYSVSNSSAYRCTRVLNSSAAGLCFETDHMMAPEDEICVVMDNYAPDQPGPERFRSYLTRIRWAQRRSAPPHEGFIAGAQIVACSHEVLIPSGDERCHRCDMCGALVQECRLQCTEENAQLCGSCHQHYRAIPEGKISECVERFLIGNVV